MASDGSQPLSMGGKLVGYNRDNQSGISFPASATNTDTYRTVGRVERTNPQERTRECQTHPTGRGCSKELAYRIQVHAPPKIVKYRAPV